MALRARLNPNGRQALIGATLAAIVVGVVTGTQACLARAGSASEVPLGLAVENRTVAALSWVVVGTGVVALSRRWPLAGEAWKGRLALHIGAALAAGLLVNLLLHSLLWLLGADAVPAAELPALILRDALDHAHLNVLVYGSLLVGARCIDRRASVAPASYYIARLTARRRGTVTVIDVDDVDWIEGADDYACLHVGSRRHLTDDRLRALEQMLDPTRFVRVHRSALVNLSRVREVTDGRSGDAVAVLRDGTRVRVSRTRRDAFMSALRVQ